jgi:hypothetical protein
MVHNLHSDPKIPPYRTYTLAPAVCHGWQPSIGLTVGLLSVAFCWISSTDEKRWPLSFIYWDCAHIRYFCPYRHTAGNITSCLFQGAVWKRIHTKSTPLSLSLSRTPWRARETFYTLALCPWYTLWVTLLPPLPHNWEVRGLSLTIYRPRIQIGVHWTWPEYILPQGLLI